MCNAFDRDEDALLTVSRTQRVMHGVLLIGDETLTFDQAEKIRRDHCTLVAIMAPLQERAEAEGWD